MPSSVERDREDLRESGAALRAYTDYVRQEPPRSLDRLAEMYQSGTEVAPPTRRLRTLKQWSTLFNWRRRAREHDRQVAQQAVERDREARVELAEQMRTGRLRIEARGLQMSLAALQRKEAQDRISAHAAVNLMKVALDGQRLDAGDPSERHEVTGAEGGPVRIIVGDDHPERALPRGGIGGLFRYDDDSPETRRFTICMDTGGTLGGSRDDDDDDGSRPATS